MKNVYVAMVNSDMTEGRGHMYPVAIASSLDIARKIANYHEPYGHQDQFCKVQHFTLIESFEDWKKVEDDEVRKDALKKLTVNEKRVLGL